MTDKSTTYQDPCPVCGCRMVGVSKAEFVDHLRANGEDLKAQILDELVGEENEVQTALERAEDGHVKEAPEKNRIPTCPHEAEPEFVGAHSAISAEQCQSYTGAKPERCENDATHTVVMFAANGLAEVAMCDGCGEPDNVEDFERMWST